MPELHHVYHLSFLSGEDHPGVGAHIIFTVDATRIHAVMERLRLYSENGRMHAVEYLEADEDFILSDPDFFGDMRFGYGACGHAIQDGASVALHVALGRGLDLRRAVLTIHLVANVLASMVDISTTPGEEKQRVNFTTLCDNNTPIYGHAMSGRVSGEFRAWLAEQCPPSLSLLVEVDVPNVVIRAMREAWCAVTDEDAHEWAQECRGWISMGGRFTLVCFGDACDISIYPDVFTDGSVFEGARFECHNLDTARQQLTLLAGLATLAYVSRQQA